MVGLLSLSN
jgi:hypothetical protein